MALKLRTRRNKSRVAPTVTPALSNAISEALANAVPIHLREYNQEFLKSFERSKGVDPRDPLTKLVTSFDFFGLYPDGIRTKQAVSGMTADMLRRMSKQCAPVQAIIQTRKNQVARYGIIPDGRNEPGFKIVLRETKRRPTKEEQKVILEIENAVLRCGVAEPDPVLGEHTFEHFLRMIVQDSLVLDAMCVEVRPGVNPKKFPAARWQAVDAAQIRKVEPEVYRQKGMTTGERQLPVLYVQYRDDRVLAEYDQNEMLYWVRNPQTDYQTMGYGVSELENMIETVTAILFTMSYNRSYFTQNSVPPGVLSIGGNVSEKTMEAFRRQWEAQVKGIANIWRTPVINAEQVQWVPFRQSAKDMEYHLYLEFLVCLATAIYQIAPEEINFQSFSARQTSIGSEASPTSRIQHSEDKGLIPLLRSIQSLMNRLINMIWPDFMFTWHGLHEYDAQAEATLNSVRLSTTKTVNEIRAEQDDDPLVSEYGEYDMVLNPIVAQVKGQGKQAAIQQAMGGPQPGQDGQPGEEDQQQEEQDPRAEEGLQALQNHQPDEDKMPELSNAMDQARQNKLQAPTQFQRSLAGSSILGTHTSPSEVWIRDLSGITKGISDKLESEGLVMASDLTGMTMEELSALLPHGERRTLLKALSDMGWSVGKAAGDEGKTLIVVL